MTPRDHKPELKPGQRIRFVGPVMWHAGAGYSGPLFAFSPEVATVKESSGNKIELECGASIHRRQVVSVLRKKEKPADTRVERWVNVYGNDPRGDADAVHRTMEEALRGSAHQMRDTTSEHFPTRRAVRLVELREGEAIVSRSSLAKAFWEGKKEATKGLPPGSFPLPEDVLNAIAKALGLKEKP